MTGVRYITVHHGLLQYVTVRYGVRYGPLRRRTDLHHSNRSVISNFVFSDLARVLFCIFDSFLSILSQIRLENNNFHILCFNRYTLRT